MLFRSARDRVWAEYPKKAAPGKRSIEQKTILVIQDADRTVIRRRQKGLLAGMYEFPSMEGYCTAEEVADYLAQRGLKAIRIQPLEEARHIFTHREWHMRGYLVRVDELEPARNDRARGDAGDWLYIRPEETRESYPIPAAFAAYTKVLSIRLGRENFKISGEEEQL